MWIRAVLMVGVLALCGSAVGGCKKKKAQPFSCERYQKRMELCENDVLGAFKKRFENDVKTGFRKAGEAETQYKMLQWRFRKRIRHKNTQRLCEKLQKLKAPRHRKRFTTMKYCYKRKGCAAFAQCLLGLW